MSLTPLRRLPPPLNPKRVGTFDLEWHPGSYVLRLVGVWFRGRYLCFYTIETFLDWLLKQKSITLFAHYGGKADFVFLIMPLVARGYAVSGIVNGSSVIMMSIKNGGHTIKLCDSFWLFLNKLANIAPVFAGENKGEVEGFDCPLSELIPYNEQDCRILYKALFGLEEIWRGLGGALRLTNASNAMTLFRAKYLTREIETNSDMNNMLRKDCFVASRVESMCKSLDTAKRLMGVDCAQSFDINSAHPSQYLKPLPAEYKGLDRKLQKRAGGAYFADVDISVPGDVTYGYAPPLPVKAEGGIRFPHGRWRGVYSDVDIELLEEYGGRVEHVHCVYHYDTFSDAASFADALFGLRLKHGKYSPIGYVCKLGSNSWFGKTAEDPHKKEVWFGDLDDKQAERCKSEILNPRTGEYEEAPADDRAYMVSEGFTINCKINTPAHEHLPIACYITSGTRAVLTRGLWACMRAGGLPLYMDTDGIKTTKLKTEPKEVLTIGKALGTWDFEYGATPETEIVELWAPAPKIYCAKLRNGETIVRAKGMRRMTYEEVLRVTNAPGFAYEAKGPIWQEVTCANCNRRPCACVIDTRMARIPEMMRQVDQGMTFEPRDVTVVKLFKGNGYKKREYSSDGSSVPCYYNQWEAT